MATKIQKMRPFEHDTSAATKIPYTVPARA